MKNIKIIFVLILALLIVSCGYKLSNKSVTSSKNRDYPKKTNYSIEHKQENKNKKN